MHHHHMIIKQKKASRAFKKFMTKKYKKDNGENLGQKKNI